VSDNAHDLCPDVQNVNVDVTSDRILIPKISPGKLIIDHNRW